MSRGLPHSGTSAPTDPTSTRSATDGIRRILTPKVPGRYSVGFIYVGPKDDYGYNQAHAEGATLLFPTSFGYFDPHMLRVAEKYPKIEFRHCGGAVDEGQASQSSSIESAKTVRALLISA